jgi:hypothetical protein
MNVMRTEFLGAGFSWATLDMALDLVLRRADEGGAFAYVATPNIDHIVRLAQQPDLRAL